MPRRRQLLIGMVMGILTAVLLAGNVQVARAHQWGSNHWHKSGGHIEIRNYNTAANWWAAEYARQDGWNKIGILYNYNTSEHTDISVFDGNWGPTGWWGLATLERLDFDRGCMCYRHIAHAHARYNSYYGGTQADIQGVFCQEIAHGWGLDHSNTSDCIGKGYYNNINTYGPHNNDDFFNMYYYH